MPESNDPNQPAPIPGDDATAAGGGSTADVGLNEGLLRKLRIRIPGYELLGVIGRGGQATVYKAIELTDSKMPVAIKILHSGPLADPTARERLRREARAMRALIGSPNIVSAFADGQTEEGHDYLIMNFIDGKPLDEFWKHRRPGTDDTESSAAQLSLFKKICDAVALAHRRGITHRDLSPSNILVDEQGEPHILDFGLARTAFDQFNSPEMKSVSVTGQFIGKLAYASPEQASGVSTAIDVRTDVYALGVILYQILTGGRYPYRVVGTLLEVLNNIIHAAPVRPSEAVEAGLAQEIQSRRTLRPTRSSRINRTVEEIVLKALAKRPEDRYQTAGELAAEIGRYLAGKPTLVSLAAQGSDEPKPSRRTTRLWRHAAASLLVVAAIAAGSAAWVFEFGSRHRPARPPTAAAASPSLPAATKPGQQHALDPHLLAELQRKMALMPPVLMSGNWRVESNSLVREEEPDLQNAYISFGDTAWTDYDFKATVSWTSFPKTIVSISAHLNDSDNRWESDGRWELDAGAYGDGNLDLWGHSYPEDEIMSGSRRWMPSEFESEMGKPYRMELKVRGDKVSAFFDGQRRCSSQNVKLTHGRVRLSATRAARFEGITVTAPDGTLLWQGPPTIAPPAPSTRSAGPPVAASPATPVVVPKGPAEVVRRLSGFPTAIGSLLFDQGDRWLHAGAPGGETGHSTVWDLRDGHVAWSDDDVYPSWAASPDGEWVFAPGELISLKTGYRRKIGSEIGGRRGQFSDDGSRFAGIGSVADAGVRVYRVSDGTRLLDQQTFFPSWVPWFGMNLSADGRRVAVAGGSDTKPEERGIQIWDVDSQREFPRVHWSGGSRIAICFSADGTQLCAAEQGTAKLFDVATGRMVRSFETSSLQGARAARSVLRRTADSLQVHQWELVGNRMSVSIWDMGKASKVAEKQFGEDELPPIPPSFSDDGRRMLALHPQGFVTAWDLRDAKQIGLYHTGLSGAVKALEISPDGTLGAAGDALGNVCVWRLP